MARTDDRWEALRVKLDCAHRWPCPYTLKCIIQPARLEEVRAVLEGHELVLRDSSGGKYQSVTTTFTARDASHVIGIYQRLAVIEGIILL
jgi:putative lipoic acid-binding regulatory protein